MLKIRKLLKERRGATEVVEILFSLGLMTFLLFYPVVMFSVNQKINLLEDVHTMAMQMVAVEGGLTSDIKNTIYLNLEAKGLLPSGSGAELRDKVKIECNADLTSGGSKIYRDAPDPKIKLDIYFPATKEISLINALHGILGPGIAPFQSSTGEWYYHLQGYIMSEKPSWIG